MMSAMLSFLNDGLCAGMYDITANSSLMASSLKSLFSPSFFPPKWVFYISLSLYAIDLFCANKSYTRVGS